ncbi:MULTISPECIES: MFS transporter [Edwardsiella]|uniref:L-Proline/Glycine betaine transporter ProP n=2 Tax=Edwardsiella anguillarum TaxID=1821960 RepID=A0A076LT50_9GAMM|nr:MULTISPECIES: MFS transporter [Edwardsiella]AIJ08779.1 L-Proline/Glycine betaine transporter ProP [Edwardsiella anguillarum ET080813]KAB0592446.1 MHS family MFS transporter [Edwardsiella anguillarum]UBU94834.1 MFS transporter [Edwardsiella sp. LADL05-105]UOU79698.1 MFS transporter [Edwardsiella anguillarum]WHP80833.1 MFS transporter [Edwardsiella anguillarum]
MELYNHRRLNHQDYKTLALAALGGALEFYDFIIFVFFAAVVGALFFPPDMPEWLRLVQTFGIFAAGYLARPLGGIIMAHFGDRIGRKRMFSLSILLMALPTLAMGMLPTYQTIGIAAPLLLLLMRVLQGAAIGGEVPGAWVFVAEHVPPQRIGFACGVLTSGLTSGILLGSLVATWLNSWLTPQEVLAGGWRIPFFLGGLFGLMAMYLRRWLHETPVFLAMQARRALAAELPLKQVVRDHRRAVAVSMLLTWLLSACIVVVILMTPSLLQTQYGLPAALTLQANSVAIVTMTLGCVLAGGLVDRVGAGRLFIGGGLLLALCTWQFFSSLSPQIEPAQLFWRYGLAGFSIGTIGAVPFVMVCAFPAEVRFSGISFSYNLAYAVFGGLTPIAVTLLLTLTPLAAGWYVLLLSLLGVALGFYFQRSPLRAAQGEARLSH